jgi:hypothetical protein
LRKLIGVAAVATVTLGLAAGATAQTSELTFKPKVTPNKAGTKKKPKSAKLQLQLSLNKPGTTVEFIDLTLPKGLKLSGKGLGDCTVDDLAFEGPAACANDKAGPQGTASAQLGADPLNFTIQPFVSDSNTMLFYVATEQGSGVAVQSPITGEITGGGTKLRIQIPPELRQPVPGVDASLTSINATFQAKKGKKTLLASTGCTNKKWKITGKLTFTTRADAAPVPGPISASSNAACKK